MLPYIFLIGIAALFTDQLTSEYIIEHSSPIVNGIVYAFSGLVSMHLCYKGYQKEQYTKTELLRILHYSNGLYVIVLFLHLFLFSEQLNNLVYFIIASIIYILRGITTFLQVTYSYIYMLSSTNTSYTSIVWKYEFCYGMGYAIAPLLFTLLSNITNPRESILISMIAFMILSTSLLLLCKQSSSSNEYLPISSVVRHITVKWQYLLGIPFLSAGSTAFIIPIFSTFLKHDIKPKPDEFQISLVFLTLSSTYTIGTVMLPIEGNKKNIIQGLLCIGISNILLGYVRNIVLLELVLTLLSTGQCLLIVSVYDIFKNNSNLTISQITFVTTFVNYIGNTVNSLLSGLLVDYASFGIAFYVFGIICIIYGIGLSRLQFV